MQVSNSNKTLMYRDQILFIYAQHLTHVCSFFNHAETSWQYCDILFSHEHPVRPFTLQTNSLTFLKLYQTLFHLFFPRSTKSSVFLGHIQTHYGMSCPQFSQATQAPFLSGWVIANQVSVCMYSYRCSYNCLIKYRFWW